MNGFQYTLAELQAMSGSNLGGNLSAEAHPVVLQSVCFDTRQIHHPETEVFVALRANRDGSHFIQQAYDRGIRHFIVPMGAAVPSGAYFFEAVNTLEALQQIAGQHRQKYSYPILAITGSNGKTIVKEWLSTLLEKESRIVKSPKSYNSQLGVPISLLQLNPEAEVGIFEVGISQTGEMERLAAIVQPDRLIFTHFGDAHAEGFSSAEEKLDEKLKLFTPQTQNILLGSANDVVLDAVEARGLPHRTIGTSPQDDLRVSELTRTPNGWTWKVAEGTVKHPMSLPIAGDAALENALLVVLAAWDLGLGLSQIAEGLQKLHPVSMRMEMITDNPEVTVINDAYNADAASIHNAFSLLASELNQPGSALILSDLEHQGVGQAQVQRSLLEEGIRQFGSENLDLIGPVFHSLSTEFPAIRTYPDTQSFLNHFRYDRYKGKVVLVKGARKFELERILPYLSRRAVAAWFGINLNALSHNYRQFRQYLGPKVKMMAMVKAFAYGSGTWEIAQALQQEGVDYLAVAYTAEGIDLRTRGIRVPIMVMNPDEDSLDQLFAFRLEPEVYSMTFLDRLCAAAQRAGESKVQVHIKVDTGMRRLGFAVEDATTLGKYIQAARGVKVEVISILSHLAAADEPELDGYSKDQIQLFHQFSEALQPYLGQYPIHHILNTAGILRFPEHAMEMVRLGIGLYGVMPCEGTMDLREIGSLHAVISQVHAYPEGVPVGYGCSQRTERPSRIATIPIGYADGIRRVLGNGKAHFLVRGQRVPTFGRICMDMLMLDVTDVPLAAEGDEVVLIGCQGNECIRVAEIAQLCDTIPYEILTGIGRRVRRIYVRE